MASAGSLPRADSMARESAEDRVARLKAAIARVESDLEVALQQEEEYKHGDAGSTGAGSQAPAGLEVGVDAPESVHPWEDGMSVGSHFARSPSSRMSTPKRYRHGAVVGKPARTPNSRGSRGASMRKIASKRSTRTSGGKKRGPRTAGGRSRPGSRGSMARGTPSGSSRSIRTSPDTNRLKQLRKKVGAVEHKLDRALTLSMELERNDGYQPLLSVGSSGRPLMSADESILSHGKSFVDTVTKSTHRITFPDPGELPPPSPMFKAPSRLTNTIKSLGSQMNMIEGVMKAQRPKYKDYTEDKDTWTSLQKVTNKPPSPNSLAFRPTYMGPRKATAPKLAGGPRPCLSEPTPEAPPQLQGQFTSMGHMVESVKRSGAYPEFSTLTRDDRKHVYINEAACISQPRSFDGPAPSDYDLPSSLMKQAESTKRSAPTAKFTTLTRPKMRCLHAETGGRAHVTPLGRNPSQNSVFFYTTVERDDPLLGAQLSSVGDAVWRPAAPSYSIGGCTQRSEVVPVHTYTSPGPVYNLPSSFGKEPTAVVMKTDTTPKVKRFHPPAFIKARSSMGHQALSRSRSNPSFGFSKSKRQTILK